MNPFERLALAVTRVATATNVRRTRQEAAVLAEANGGDWSDIIEKANQAAKRLETIAARLEVVG